MPSPSTPKRSSLVQEDPHSASKIKAVDLGDALGVYDTSTVRDRVRQWQAQGGGVIPAPDVCIIEDEHEESSSKRRTPRKRSSPKTTGRKASDKREEYRRSPQKRVGRQTSQSVEEDDRSRSQSAPPKRVVSDTHWRKNKSPPCSGKKPKTPNHTVSYEQSSENSIRVSPLPGHKTTRKRQYDSGRSSARLKAESDNLDDGIRVHSSPPSSRRYLDEEEIGDGDLGIDSNEVYIGSSRSTSPLPQASSGKCRTARGSPQQASFTFSDKSRRRKIAEQKDLSVGESPLSRSGNFSEERTSTKSHKGGILSQVFGESRKIFSKQAPVPIGAPRVPSIEAWLNETPDPFLDGEEPPLEIIPPLRPHRRSKRIEHGTTSISSQSPDVKLEQVPAPDPNHIWDALDSKEGTRRHVTSSRRKRRVRSSAIYEDNPFPENFDAGFLDNVAANGSSAAPKLVDITQDTPNLPPSPTSMKRRGATRASSSPTRDRRKSFASRENIVQDDARSAASSAMSGSSVDGPPPSNSLRTPGITIKRPFPSTGQHRLSTIASVETFGSRMQAAPSISEASEANTLREPVQENEAEAEAIDLFDPQSLERTRSHLTKHADLISVLSLPKASNQSIVSARSIRTNRSRLATATIGDLMSELATDESKYMRELRTLVDGVIPVLLSCVLSKSDSAIAAGLFRPTSVASEDPNFTKPIVDMGIALERLKTLHKRIPQQDPKSFLTWAHGAQRVYVEYIRAWRMGFQDVVVNLAPAAEKGTSSTGQSDELDGGLPRNADGDVVNGDGERVDVAFLLKRPLVRLKYLAKTLKGINFVQASLEAEDLSKRYQNLVIDARNRSNEERARLEDETAAAIDSTRARDPRTLAPLTGVTIDKTRHVRARDHFNLALQHSSGQLVDCRVELLLRDEAPGQASEGDLLVCEVDSTGRRLFFPPLQSGRVSARNGDNKGEVIVMIRGISTNGVEWHELLTLRSDDEQAGFEWVQMLGLTPVPPKIMRMQSFLRKHQRNKSGEQASTKSDSMNASGRPGKSRTPSPREIEVPIGEQANSTSKTWLDTFLHGSTSSSHETSRLQKKPTRASPPVTPSKVPQKTYIDEVNDLRSLPSQRNPQPSEPVRAPRSLNEALGLTGTSTMSGIRRTKAKRMSKTSDEPGQGSRPEDDYATHGDATTPPSEYRRDAQCATNREDAFHDPRVASPVSGASRSSPQPCGDSKKSPRPTLNGSQSSVPSMELPTIPKIRRDSPPSMPIQEPEVEPEWPKSATEEPSHTSTKLVKGRASPSKSKQEDVPPPTPAHRSPSPVQVTSAKTPNFTPGNGRPRRSSSPLKHEYAPSSSSNSSSESETSTVAHNERSSVSDSSDDEGLEPGDISTPLMPLGMIAPSVRPTPPSSLYSLPNGTLAPSNSASQAPYKTVPFQPAKASKTIASIFSWADDGSWQSLHPDECSIVITPGLIEAYAMSAAHSDAKPISASSPVIDVDAFSEITSTILSDKEQVQTQRPLVGLEVTPLVPIRRGTAIDISIRSPPTPKSQLKPGVHIMFRSRNPEECEALYALINHARINNPTFIALQNARGPTTTASSMDRRLSGQGGSRSSPWFGFGRSPSYRASSGRSPSIAPSESSIGSMSSAFSALKRFSGVGGGMFNISQSTISSRAGSRANSIYTTSDNSSGTGTAGSGASSPLPPGMSTSADKMGLSNAKIRLYIRETASRWRDMGSARLTIMQPTALTLHPGFADGAKHLKEKRVLVNGKTKGEVLLDVQLGESCFERVARTGIAVSVWEDVVGPNGEVGVVNAIGGVAGGRVRVYMIQVCHIVRCNDNRAADLEMTLIALQMKSEAETAYTFSIVGKLRY